MDKKKVAIDGIEVSSKEYRVRNFINECLMLEVPIEVILDKLKDELESIDNSIFIELQKELETL